MDDSKGKRQPDVNYRSLGADTTETVFPVSVGLDRARRTRNVNIRKEGKRNECNPWTGSIACLPQPGRLVANFVPIYMYISIRAGVSAGDVMFHPGKLQ